MAKVLPFDSKCQNVTTIYKKIRQKTDIF